MSARKLSTMILAVAASLSVFTAASQAQKKPPAQPAAASQQVPAEYQAGIAQLRAAKGYLAKAGDKWCGYRIQAISSIDKALQALGANPEETRNEMSTGNTDEPAMLNSGMASLQSAKADLEKAGNGYGGRKSAGLANINEALHHLQQGVTCAKEHHTY